jgi:hypothetical protein
MGGGGGIGIGIGGGGIGAESALSPFSATERSSNKAAKEDEEAAAAAAAAAAASSPNGALRNPRNLHSHKRRNACPRRRYSIGAPERCGLMLGLHVRHHALLASLRKNPLTRGEHGFAYR